MAIQSEDPVARHSAVSLPSVPEVLDQSGLAQGAYHRRRSRPARLLFAANLLAMMAVAIWFRCRMLGNLPGFNGDEAWYGVKALEVLRGQGLCLQTPTGNPINPFFLGPLVLLHACFSPSIVLLRCLAVGSGLAALVINWLLCRWVFDRRTAAISTVLLALLPINIAYSRLAWDASQSLGATLAVLYLGLAAVRFRHRAGRCLAAAILAQLGAVLVHPTNIFAAAALTGKGSGLFSGVRRTCPGFCSPRRTLSLLAATILIAALAVYWIGTPGPSRLIGRIHDARTLGSVQASSSSAVLYPRLLAGGTVYRYVAGSHSWFEWPCGQEGNGWGIDVAICWTLLAAAVWVLWRSSRASGRAEDLALVAAWALGLAAFLLVAGPRAMTSGQERWAMCLVGPSAVLLSRGLALCVESRSSRWHLGLVAASLAGWLLLADFQVHYFDHIQRTGGRAHRAFRTAAVEPKQAALRTILRHRRPGETWVVAGEWWDYWPLRYLGMAEDGIHVVTPEQLESLPQSAQARSQGQIWYVEFSNGGAVEEVQAALEGREVQQWQMADFGGRPVLSVLHPSADGTSPSAR